MPIITNLHNLPEAFVAAVTNDPYTNGGADISVTTLIDAPQIRQLKKAHADAITVDVSERIWALLGQAVHTILERAALRAEGMVAETRLFATVNGWTLSGQFDVMALETGMLSDYKVTSTAKVTDLDKWTQQLNILRWLAAQNGQAVTGLEIIAILRDWKKGQAEKSSTYPQQPVLRIPIPVWTLEETEMFIIERIQLHQYAEKTQRLLCTDEERWYTGTTYALTKAGATKATRLSKDPIPPDEVPEGSYVEERRGEYRRCASYCEVRAFCSQAKLGDP